MDQVEKIKNKVDIVELIGEYLPLKKTGRNYKALCPFHSEKTPSFIVSPQLQIFKCFGCGAGGDAIKFLQLYEKMDFWEAVEFLGRRVGVEIKRIKPSGDELIRRKIYQLNQAAAEFYHFILNKHPVGKAALNYILNRGIKKASLVRFQLGFSPLNPGAIAAFLIRKRGFRPPDLLQAGLAVSSRYQPQQLIDRFRGRLIFPLHDHRGNIIGFSGRLVPGLLKNEDQRGKYINTPDTIAYHKGENLYGLFLNREAIKKKKKIIIVEGELDLISSWQIGIKNVVALKGTAFTPDQLRLLKRYADTLILALDEDFAGNEASLHSIQLAENEGLDIKAVDLKGKFKDPDEAAQKNPTFLKKAVRKPTPVWDFVIKKISQKYSPATISGKKKILAETLPFLIKIENEMVKTYYLRRLAKVLKVSPEAVLIEAEKLAQKRAFSSRTTAPTPLASPPEKRREILEAYLLGLIFSSPQPKKFLHPKNARLLKIFRWQRIFQLARRFSRKKTFSPAQFLAFLPEELRPQFEQVFLTTGEREIDWEKEIAATVRQLKKIAIKEKLKELSLKIGQAEKEKDKKSLEKWEKSFISFSQKLVELEREE